MAQIIVDTDKDSKQTLRKVISFLQQFVNEDASWSLQDSSDEYAIPNSSSPSVEEQPSSSDMFSMFGSSSNSPESTPSHGEPKKNDRPPRLQPY